MCFQFPQADIMETPLNTWNVMCHRHYRWTLLANCTSHLQDCVELNGKNVLLPVPTSKKSLQWALILSALSKVQIFRILVDCNYVNVIVGTYFQCLYYAPLKVCFICINSQICTNVRFKTWENEVIVLSTWQISANMDEIHILKNINVWVLLNTIPSNLNYSMILYVLWKVLWLQEKP